MLHRCLGLNAPYTAKAIIDTVHKIRESTTHQERMQDVYFVSDLLKGRRPTQIKEDEVIVWDGDSGNIDGDDAEILQWLITAGAFHEDAKVAIEALVRQIQRGPVLVPSTLEKDALPSITNSGHTISASDSANTHNGDANSESDDINSGKDGRHHQEDNITGEMGAMQFASAFLLANAST